VVCFCCYGQTTSNRENARAAICLDDEDREEVLTVLGDVVARFDWFSRKMALH
jgi:hypothetical protein